MKTPIGACVATTTQAACRANDERITGDPRTGRRFRCASAEPRTFAPLLFLRFMHVHSGIDLKMAPRIRKKQRHINVFRSNLTRTPALTASPAKRRLIRTG
jgi:hypothetical protein